MTDPSPLASRKAAPAHVAPLDGMRGLLTLLVLFHHVVAAIHFLYVVPQGVGESWQGQVSFVHGTAIALPMYFVISGFVIYLPAARGDGTLGDLGWYALRRFARIVPAYYLTLGFLLLSWPFLFPEMQSPMATREGVAHVLGHLAFLQKLLFYEWDIGFGLNGSVWTLTLEEMFYFAIALLAPFFHRAPARSLVIALVATLLFRASCYFLPEIAAWAGWGPFDPELPSHLFHQFPGYFVQFALGCFAATLYVRLWSAERARWTTALTLMHAGCLVSLALLMWRVGRMKDHRLGVPFDITYDIVPAFVFAALILAVVLGAEGGKRPYTNAFSRFLGDVSYGVYLWHMVLIQVVFRWTHLQKAPPEQSLLLFLGVVLPGSLLLGWLSFRFVERPLSLYARRVWLGRQPGAGVRTSGAS